MKYDEIKVGESYEVGKRTEKVIAKSNEHKVVMTIDAFDYPTAWDKNELKHFKPIKKELPESGLLVRGDTIVYRTGEKSGFGFNPFGFCEDKDILSFSRSPENWKPATPEDEAKFIKMLKAEAEKRCLGVDAKIKGHAYDIFTYPVNDGKWDAKFDLYFANNKNGRIFHNGIWAEPLTMLDEVTEVIKKHLPNIVVEQVDGVVTLKQL